MELFFGVSQPDCGWGEARGNQNRFSSSSSSSPQLDRETKMFLQRANSLGARRNYLMKKKTVRSPSNYSLPINTHLAGPCSLSSPSLLYVHIISPLRELFLPRQTTRSEEGAKKKLNCFNDRIKSFLMELQ
jgi:hypothetical protein